MPSDGIGVLHLGDHQRAAVQRKAGAGRVLLLRIAASSCCCATGLPLNTPTRKVSGSIGRARSAHAERRQRIGRAAAGQVGRGQHRPAEHGVDEVAGVLADHEFLVEALLADLDVEPVLLEEFLLVPELPQAGGAVGLDAAGGLQGQQIVGAEVAAVDLQRADVEQCRRTSRRRAWYRAAAPSGSGRHRPTPCLAPPVTLPSTSLVS